jgi:hypothetical protein
MMNHATVAVALLGAGFLVGQMVPVVWSQPGGEKGALKKGPPGGPKGPPEHKGPPPGHGPQHGPPHHGPHAFREAYESLGEASALLKVAGDRVPSEVRKLTESGVELYKLAIKEAKEGDRRKADGYARAAADTGRGLRHLLHDLIPAASDLPKPPMPEDHPQPPPAGRPGAPGE